MYREEFSSAIERTKAFGLSCPEVQFLSGLLLTADKMSKFPYVLRETVGEIGVKEVVAQCLSIHYQLVEPISLIFGAPVYFTIGHVETQEGLMFHQTAGSLQSILRNGIRGTTLNIHAWLTLPTMEVMDFSLPTSYAVLNKIPDGIGGLIATHPDTLKKGMKYHPMLVGEDFLIKSGGLVEYGI